MDRFRRCAPVFALLAAWVLAVAPARPEASKAAPVPIQSVSPVFKDAVALQVKPSRLDDEAAPGAVEHVFIFHVTNVSAEDVTIIAANTSCGCSVARLPAQPWVLAPGQGGDVRVTVDLVGKHGVLAKVATLDTLEGRKVLAMTLRLPEQAAGDARGANLQQAIVDRQAVFKGACAACHATPTIGLRGTELYSAACGICHEAENRASMVPDLSARAEPRSRAEWQQMIVEGKPGTLMPAFATKAGGPLDDAQIESLVNYLTTLPRPRASK